MVKDKAASLRLVKTGRPSSFTEEMADKIVAELAEGRSLTAICAADDMPGRRTVLDWQERDEAFRARCARAREAGAEIAFDCMTQIEADVLAGKVEASAGRTVLSSMQWRLSKIAPKRFGDKLQLAGDAEQPLAIQAEMTPGEAARRVLFAMELARRNALQIEAHDVQALDD